MTGATSNKPIGLAVFIWIITFTILGYGIYLFGVNYRYILTGESIDLDEYIEKSVDDLPFGKIVDMTITESYGRFYSRTSGGRHRTTTHYYAVECLDGSVIIFGSSIYEPHQGVLTGRLSKIKVSDLETEFNSYIESLKGQGVIDRDTEIRYAVFVDGWGRAGYIVLLVFIFVISLLLILLGVEIVRGKI